MGLVNEKKIGESAAESFAPILEKAQTRAENWVGGLLERLKRDEAVQLEIVVAGVKIQARVELVPK